MQHEQHCFELSRACREGGQGDQWVEIYNCQDNTKSDIYCLIEDTERRYLMRFVLKQFKKDRHADWINMIAREYIVWPPAYKMFSVEWLPRPFIKLDPDTSSFHKVANHVTSNSLGPRFLSLSTPRQSKRFSYTKPEFILSFKKAICNISQWSIASSALLLNSCDLLFILFCHKGHQHGFNWIQELLHTSFR